MKSVLTYLSAFLLIAFTGANVHAMTSGDSTVQKYSLTMNGQIKFKKQGLNKALISVYLDSTSTLVRQVESDEKGWGQFRIPIQKFYVIRISKPGYITKIITVDAKMPKSHQTGDYYFEFSADLLEEIPELDVSILKKPVAKIFFNTFTKKFDYDFNYTVTILKDLKALYDNHKLLKKQ